jgi:hypothetical protein
MRESFFLAANLPSNPREASNYLTERLNRAYDSFLESQPANTYVKVNKDGWQLSADTTEKLDSQEEEKLEHLKNWLQKQMRSIRLPDLLIEVDNELRYTHHFLHTNYKEKRSVLDVCSILAAIIAYGCNVGPYTMSRMVNGISYSQIQRITDWQLTEDNQRSALASVVNAIARLDTSQIGVRKGKLRYDAISFPFIVLERISSLLHILPPRLIALNLCKLLNSFPQNDLKAIVALG